MGSEIDARPEQCGTTAKPSEWERAAIKTRVQGGALVFFPPTFFKESRAPARGRAGNGALRPKAASEAPTQRVRSTGLPLVGGPGLDRRRLAPARWFPARSRAGIQAFSRESPDAKSRGGGPPPPLG